MKLQIMLKLSKNTLIIMACRLRFQLTEQRNTARSLNPFAAVVSSEDWHCRAKIDTNARVLVVLAKFAG